MEGGLINPLALIRTGAAEGFTSLLSASRVEEDAQLNLELQGGGHP